MPLVTLMRKEATLGNSNNRNEFVSVKHEKYPDYEVWIGAIDRMGQLKVSWFLTVALPNIITAKMTSNNIAAEEQNRTKLRLSQQFGKMLAQKIKRKNVGQADAYPRQAGRNDDGRQRGVWRVYVAYSPSRYRKLGGNDERP